MAAEKIKNEFKVKEWKLEELKNRKIWIPYMCDAAFILASIFRALGYNSEVLPRSNDVLLSLGRKYTDGDQCLPSIITTEDILKRVFSPDFNKNKEAFFQGKSEGPCRFGRYYMNQLLILHQLDKDNVPIFTLDNRNSYGGLGTEAKILAYDGIVSQGILEKVLYFTRPFEVNKGEAERVYKKYLNEVCEIIEKTHINKIKILINTHKSELIAKLKEAYNEFSKIEKKDGKKPIIFITGEIFVRSSSVANQSLVDKIENLGGVAYIEPVIAFFDYIHEIKRRDYKEGLSYNFFKDFLNFMKTKIDIKITERDTHGIEKIFANLFLSFSEHNAKTIVDRGSKYVHPSYIGEAIVTLGSSDYFSSCVDGIINAMPFTCMPGTIVRSMTNELRKNNKDIPFLNLPYDGTIDSGREEQLEIFMYQVKEKKEAEKRRKI